MLHLRFSLQWLWRAHLYSLVEIKWFRGTYCHHLQGWSLSQVRNQQNAGGKQSFLILKTEAVHSSEMPANFYQTTWYYIPEDSPQRVQLILRSEILIVVIMKRIFWDMMPSSTVEVYRSSGGRYCLHLQDQTSRRSACHLNVQFTHQPWRWRQYVPPKRRYSCTTLDHVTSQKIVIWSKYFWSTTTDHYGIREVNSRWTDTGWWLNIRTTSVQQPAEFGSINARTSLRSSLWDLTSCCLMGANISE
jgi:hypothetical protein